MFPDLFLEEAPCGSILVSDHQVFAFWVVAYRRFNCILIRLFVLDFCHHRFSVSCSRRWTGETLLCTSWPNWNTQVSILFMVVNFIVQYKMYYVRFTVSYNPFVCLRYLQLIQITNNMLFWFTMARKEKPNPILFLFVIKIIITPCLVNNNVKKKADKTSTIITIHGDEYQFED